MLTEFRAKGLPPGERLWRRGALASEAARRLARWLFVEPAEVPDGVVSPGELSRALVLFEQVGFGPPATERDVRAIAAAAEVRVGGRSRSQVTAIVGTVVPPLPSALALAVGVRLAVEQPPPRGELWRIGERAFAEALEAERRFGMYHGLARALRDELAEREAGSRPVRRPDLRLVGGTPAPALPVPAREPGATGDPRA